MKKIILAFFIFGSLNLMAFDEYECNYKKHKIKFNFSNKSLIQFDVHLKNLKLFNCTMDAKWEENIKNESELILIRLKKKECHYIYDKLAKDIIFIENGYLKMDTKKTQVSAYIIKNEMPFLCEKSKLRSK